MLVEWIGEAGKPGLVSGETSPAGGSETVIANVIFSVSLAIMLSDLV